ncbi:hypothetical protein LTR08_003362 [Meristemomyces frigidus]|nr:hypothetical protein LTR08_003362 [Meristemomyces frigidus]
MRHFFDSFALPASLLILLATSAVDAEDLAWPYNLPRTMKYYPEDEAHITREMELRRRLLRQAPSGMRKMSGDDEGEKFFLHYWNFGEEPAQPELQDQQLEYLNTTLAKPALLAAIAPHTNHNGLHFGRNLFARGFECPGGSTVCSALGSDLCCPTAETCVSIAAGKQNSTATCWQQTAAIEGTEKKQASWSASAGSSIERPEDPLPQFRTMPGPQDDENRSRPNKSNKDASTQSSPKPKGGSILQFEASTDVKRFAKRYRTEISASSSSIISTFVAFPLDFAKSRMQSYETSFTHTIKDAYKAEGLRAFWRGVGPPIASVTVVRTISFSLYQRMKYVLDERITRITGHSPLAIANAPGSYPNAYTMACFGLAGAASGALITTLSCPFELTKLNEQLAGKMAREARSQAKSAGSTMVEVKTGSWNTARRLVQDRGWRGLYSGYSLHLLRDTIGTAIYFTTYESVKQLMANSQGRDPTSPYAVLAAGGLCGVLTSALIYPIDVAKTLFQKALLSAGSGHAARPKISFFQTGSYRGLGVSVLRSCMLNMIFFSNFESVKKAINALEVD